MIRGHGNCPRCRLAVITRSGGVTPRHGHVLWFNPWTGKMEWMPSCKGSGRKAANIVWSGKTPV